MLIWLHIAIRHISKAKALHVRVQDPISETTESDAQAVCKFQCLHQAITALRQSVVKAKYKWKNNFEVDKIINHKGSVTGRKYLIHCKNYFHEWGSWVPRTNLHPDMIKEYELKTGSYVQNWPHRCPQCDIPCAYARGIKIHISKAHKPNMEKPQDFKQRQAC